MNYPFSQSEIAHTVFAVYLPARPPVLGIYEACSAFTHVATRSLAHQPEADFACLRATHRQIGRLPHLDYSPCCYPKLGGPWLFPPWDFPHQMRVTLWTTTAMHPDTLKVKI